MNTVFEIQHPDPVQPIDTPPPVPYEPAVPKKPEFSINGKDARTTWGIVVNTKLTDALLLPPSTKAPIQSESRLEHGVRTIIPEGSVKWDKRDITLEIGITAPDRATFLARYDSLMAEFLQGWLKIKTSHIPGKTFKCRYVSCQQFTNYNGRIAKFILKLEEPNPNDRT